MALRAGPPRPSEPSRWTRKLNGDDDKITGYDDGEPLREYRSSDPGEPITGALELETAEIKLKK